MELSILICKYKKRRDDQVMVESCGADASVVASWVGWIRTLTSVLVVSLDGIVSSTGALSWSYGRGFRGGGNFRSPFRSCETGVLCYEMALVCQGASSQLWKFSQRRMGGCETISQREAIFAAVHFWLRNFAGHALSLLFELLLIPNFLLSTLLTFLLILIIQKPILHQNKLELKHWNQN